MILLFSRVINQTNLMKTKAKQTFFFFGKIAKQNLFLK